MEQKYELEPNRTRLHPNWKPKERFSNGVKVKILRDYWNNNLIGKIGIIQDSMWDWPNWEYTIQTEFGVFRSWDCDIEVVK